MADQNMASWYPTAAYLYVLHLDGPALAWEYLRRNPDYRRDWLRRRRQPEAAKRWGLRLLEDPSLDARDAHPIWLPGHGDVIQLHPDIDPPASATAFVLWRLPGHKHMIHDGRRLVLVTRWPGCCLRLALAPDLEDGMAYVYALRACATPCTRFDKVSAKLGRLIASFDAGSIASALPRPRPTALLELHTLQALDATLADASLREVAVGLFGVDAVADDWYADGGLRSRVRRLVRRGRALMRGDYRRLAQLE
ncbi:DUF2285 domain-containing protein [Burkholderia pseudomallei]|uniref:DUF2285 domain-containing protein n=1 Tax=Burkholderia pseudomallei TaxID=28450 RepID=UPI003F654ABB